MQNDKGPCPACGRWRNRALTVDAVLIDAGRVLLVKRKNDPYRGYWALPGGYMDFDETAQAASARELAEETGIIARASVFIGLFDDPARHSDQAIAAAYLVTKWEGKVQAGDDAAEAGWFPVTALPANVAFDHRKIIERGCLLI
jgi:8-oxo-dGTP diphosphatase